MAHSPAVIAISGIKNSGKTTLLTKIIPLLRQRGLRVAVIKHDGHDFNPDVSGTDSYRIRNAGAEGVAVYSGSKYMVVKEQKDPSLEQLLPFFEDMDLVLLEGAKYSHYPKIEIVRKANSCVSVCHPGTLLALCTDADLVLENIPVIHLNDYPGIVHRILEHMAAE